MLRSQGLGFRGVNLQLPDSSGLGFRALSPQAKMLTVAGVEISLKFRIL